MRNLLPPIEDSTLEVNPSKNQVLDCLCSGFIPAEAVNTNQDHLHATNLVTSSASLV